MNVTWVIQQFMMDRVYPGQTSLADAAREAGYDTIVIEMTQVPDLWADQDVLPECVVSYGTHQFIRRMGQTFQGNAITPLSYSKIERLSYQAYAPYLGDLLLNDDFILLPFGEFGRRGLKAFGGEVFIKPSAVTKAFTGLVINESNFEIEMATLKQVCHVDPELLCVIAKPKEIKGEFRFVIADNEVVTGSEYRWDDVLDIRSDVHPDCLAVAQEVARRDWQADTVYVCDVALTDAGSRVIELNSFSSSGLYACDTRKIVEAVSRSAWKENQGLD